jgi:cell division protein FtsQ
VTSGRPAGRRRLLLRPRDPWQASFFVVLALAIAAGAAWVVLGSSLLGARHVRVTGNGPVPAAKVIAAAAIRPGTPLVRLDLAAVAARVDRLAAVRSARVSRVWPDTVLIAVSQRVPVLAVRSAGRFALVAGSGRVTGWSARRPAGVPLLTAPAGAAGGSPAVRAAAAVVQALAGRLPLRLVSVSAGPADAITLRLRGGITVLWGSPARSAAKASELAILLRTHAHYYDVSAPGTVATGG